MTAAHTPGPWELVTDAIPAGSTLVAVVRSSAIIAKPSAPMTPAVNGANARLIASAPELLRQRDALMAKLPRCTYIDCCRLATTSQIPDDGSTYRCDQHQIFPKAVALPWAPEVREIEGNP